MTKLANDFMILHRKALLHFCNVCIGHRFNDYLEKAALSAIIHAEFYQYCVLIKLLCIFFRHKYEMTLNHHQSFLDFIFGAFDSSWLCGGIKFIFCP